jgi:hypothetical protein
MADYDSSLPVRTEDDADEKLQTKIVDYADPSGAGKQLAIDADSNAHVEVHGDNPAGGDETLRLSELGSASVDGLYDVSNNSDPSNVGLIAHTRAASPADSDQIKKLTAISNSDVHALDVAIRDESGAAFSSANPMPVSVSQAAGTEYHDYDTGAAIAAAATSNHDYSVANGDVFLLEQIEASASSKMKIEVQIGDGAVSEVFATKFVLFNSTATPNISLELKKPLEVLGTANTTTIRVIRTNRDNQAQDLFSTIIGVVE